MASLGYEGLMIENPAICLSDPCATFFLHGRRYKLKQGKTKCARAQNCVVYPIFLGLF